jgi:predicted Zn-dependent protease
LLEGVETPEELAAVLAHEIAHVRQRHNLRQVAEMAGPVLVAKYLLGSRNSLMATLAVTSAYLGGQRYSRQNEREADTLAWDYLLAANINPEGMLTFFQKLEQTERGLRPPEILSSHPPTEERIESLKAKVGAIRGTRKFKPFPPLEQPQKERSLFFP